MSLIRAIRCASAPLEHRLGVGDRRTLRVDTKSPRSLPQSLLCAPALSCPIGEIPAATCAAVPICTASFHSATIRCDSNPHSAIPPLASCQSARGFLPQGLSDAYRRPC
jgi:hypothetical protein